MNTSPRFPIAARLRALAAACAAACALCAAPSAAAQGAVGTVTGRVINEATQAPLWNAVVAVKGTALSAATDRDGGFVLAGVPAGPATLSVSYTGLTAAEQAVEVGAGRTVARDIALTADVYKLAQFVVSGLREGQSLAIQQQRQAPNVKLVTAIDAFGNPAANPGELIQRLPEVSTEIVGSEVRGIFIRGMDPSFSVLQVDGQQMATSRGTGASREYQIEQQGTGNIQAIELIKAPRPEDDANSIAGYVNLITRRAYDSPGRQLRFTLGTMWRQRDSGQNPEQDRPGLDQFAVSYSDIFSVAGGNRNLGVAFNFGQRHSATTQDEVGAGLTATGPGALWFRDGPASTPLLRAFGTGDFFYDAVATNIGLNVDYKLGDMGYAYVKAAYNTNKQYQRFYRWDITAPAAASGFTAASSADFSQAVPSGGASRAATYSALFDKYSKNFSVNPGVSLKLFGNTATLDASAFYSYANIKYPDYNTVTSTTDAAAPQGLGWSLDFRNRDVQYPAFAQTAGPSWSDPASYRPTGNSRIVWWAPSTYRNFKADFAKDLASAVPVTLKAGVKYSVNLQEPRRDQVASTWTGAGTIAPYVEAQYRQANGHYGPFPFILYPGLNRGPKDILSSSSLVITDANAYNNFVSSTTGDGRFEETLTAAYVQARLKLGPLGVLAGVRFEETENEAEGFLPNNTTALAFNPTLTRQQNLDRAGARFAAGRTRIDADYRKVHPGLHLTYDAGRGLLFRASYNNSISRPNIPSTVPFGGNVNPDTQTVSAGNPGLKPYTSRNYEVSAEKYFEPVGKFTLGGFYKDISDYFTNFTSVVPAGADNGFGGQFAGYTLTTPRNIGDATIKGWSVDYAQQFSTLPGFWKGFGVFANFTRLRAKGQFSPNVAGTANFNTLPGLVPKSANAGLSYAGHGLQLRLLAGYRGEFVIGTPAATAANASNIQYRDRRTLWDLKSAYRLNRTFELFLDVYNLTNEPTSTVRVAGRETFTLWQGTSFSAGVNARF